MINHMTVAVTVLYPLVASQVLVTGLLIVFIVILILFFVFSVHSIGCGIAPYTRHVKATIPSHQPGVLQPDELPYRGDVKVRRIYLMDPGECKIIIQLQVEVRGAKGLAIPRKEKGKRPATAGEPPAANGMDKHVADISKVHDDPALVHKDGRVHLSRVAHQSGGQDKGTDHAPALKNGFN